LDCVTFSCKKFPETQVSPCFSTQLIDSALVKIHFQISGHS
jgi:hypothetical protein